MPRWSQPQYFAQSINRSIAYSHTHTLTHTLCLSLSLSLSLSPCVPSCLHVCYPLQYYWFAGDLLRSNITSCPAHTMKAAMQSRRRNSTYVVAQSHCLSVCRPILAHCIDLIVIVKVPCRVCRLWKAGPVLSILRDWTAVHVFSAGNALHSWGVEHVRPLFEVLEQIIKLSQSRSVSGHDLCQSSLVSMLHRWPAGHTWPLWRYSWRCRREVGLEGTGTIEYIDAHDTDEHAVTFEVCQASFCCVINWTAFL